MNKKPAEAGFLHLGGHMRFFLCVVAIGALLLWATQRLLHSGFFALFDATPISEQLAIVLLSLLPLMAAAAWNTLRPSPRKSAFQNSLLVAAILVLGVFGAYLVYDASNKTGSVAAIAAAAATIGWIVQRQNATDISRKQHTLSVILQMRQSELFHKHRTNLFSEFPDGVSILAADVEPLLEARRDKGKYALAEDGKHKFPVVESIYFIANFNEFLAAAVRQGDLDSDLLKQSIRSLVVGLYNKCKPLIEFDMQLDASGKPTKSTWENYSWLVNKHWKQ